MAWVIRSTCSCEKGSSISKAEQVRYLVLVGRSLTRGSEVGKICHLKLWGCAGVTCKDEVVTVVPDKFT